ncbi:inactivation-no-after-potential D protein isoform X2 [Culicoides brevitarsis]|uniref:inactivation-no-after-potential D protein isoform X2 n=1 Tax=Culicoides brevitarsis TaxID=469753 RepID=UPI00307BFC0D
MTVTCPGVDSNNLSNFDSDSAWGNEREVTLVRQGKTSFGISIVGGKVNVGDSVVSGIFIKNVIDNSPADACGQLKIGDRILVVDGTDIRDSTHEAAVETIKKAGDCLKLIVQSLNKGGSSNENGGFDFIKKGPPPVTPSKTPDSELIQPGLSGSNSRGNLLTVNGGDGDDISIRSKTPNVQTESEGSDSDDDEDTRDLEGRTHSKGGMEIDRASAAFIKRSKDEIDADPEEEDVFGYTMIENMTRMEAVTEEEEIEDKIKKRYGTLGQVLCYSINRGTNSSIGISLAGHRDRNKMACFVAGINPKGVAKQCDLEVGDEILEVNGIVLHGRCHLNASAIIKGLPGPVLKMIVLRRKAAVDDLAVKPVTQFPVEIDNEDIFASFKNVHTVTVKKGNQSLGIMIIEGKHAEVGQGIFISDIQEGSNAEKAGLNIGDMILAVNKDSLLGCNYETAASMLKKTEGLVTLTVCNPNKKGEGEKPSADGAESKSNSIISTKSEAKGPSRPITPKPQPSPAKEHHADPSTAEIHANENATIEIVTEKKPLGVVVVGGNDTLVTTGAVIVDILPDSVAAKDNRLKPFDQILEINGQKITPDLNGEQVQRAVKQLQQKFRLIIHRSEPIETETLEIELFKKPGKNLGVGFTVGNPLGIVLSSIIKDGIVEADGRLQKGDIVTHVNSESISNKPFDECSTILKTVQGRVVLKILRARPNKRMLN